MSFGEWLIFIFNSLAFGVGLAMDAFSVSLANGLNDPKMSRKRECVIAGTYAFFQIAMPLIGWFCVHTAAQKFKAFSRFIPWIALLLLCYIGGKMLWEGFHPEDENSAEKVLSVATLLTQGVATSIDALSVGFAIEKLTFSFALTESFIIGLVTFAICMVGLSIGKKFGVKLAGKATVLGGVILIAIGLEIFIKSFL